MQITTLETKLPDFSLTLSFEEFLLIARGIGNTSIDHLKRAGMTLEQAETLHTLVDTMNLHYTANKQTTWPHIF